MQVPVLGIVENMSYYQCPDCGKRHSIFGESHLEEVAARHGIENTARIPISPAIATSCDMGLIEKLDTPWLDGFGLRINRTVYTACLFRQAVLFSDDKAPDRVYNHFNASFRRYGLWLLAASPNTATA